MVSDIRVFERVFEYCAGIVNEVKRDNSFQIKYSTSIIQLDAKLIGEWSGRAFVDKSS